MSFNLNMDNVFILIKVAIIIPSALILFWGLANGSIPKKVLGILAFLVLAGIGIWITTDVADNTNLNGIRGYIAAFSYCCMWIGAIQILRCGFCGHQMEYEESYRIQKISRFFIIMAMALIIILLIFN